ncbi:MAG: hypothetical protein OXI18_09365 [bacterium]|nr:hypothetical protein [bacterium]
MTSQAAHAILREVLADYQIVDRWADSPFERIRRIETASRGKVGQKLVARLCEHLELACEFGEVQSPWDVKIEGRTFEVKTATEGANGTFQFNHIRYHRRYEFLLCVGITPVEIVFDAWSKADVVTERAGHLVTMERGANASYKLTKRTAQMSPIDGFRDHVLRLSRTP